MLSSIHLKSVDLSTKYAFLTGLALKLYKIKADNWITWHAHKTHLDVSEACKRKPSDNIRIACTLVHIILYGNLTEMQNITFNKRLQSDVYYTEQYDD